MYIEHSNGSAKTCSLQISANFLLTERSTGFIFQNTPDYHPILDTHPAWKNIVLGAGFSGKLHWLLFCLNLLQWTVPPKMAVRPRKAMGCLWACAICTDSDSSHACANSHPGIYSPLVHLIVSNDILLADSEGLHIRTVWSGSSLSAYARRQVFASRGPASLQLCKNNVLNISRNKSFEYLLESPHWALYSLQK